jgi:GT2 family glycosyltransferase
MFGVVIIAYKRPELLAQILENLDKRVSRVYIFVDFDPNNSEENLKCKAIALEAANKDKSIHSKFPNKNLGPGRAVPSAITWAFEGEETLLVLEDDCVPSAASISYFQSILETYPGAEIICGSSPFDFMGKTSKMNRITTSKYALISGWVISKSTWLQLEIENIDKYSYRDVIKSGLRNPGNFVSLSFFYASMIRVRGNLAQAWDSFLCFSMLVNNVHSIIPNVTLISNLGLDKVASNTKSTDVSHSNVYQAASNLNVAQQLDTTKRLRRLTNREIEKSIYNLKFRHIFSPLKSNLLSR